MRELLRLGVWGVWALILGDTDGLEKFDTFGNGRKEVNLPYVQYNLSLGYFNGCTVIFKCVYCRF